MEWVNSEELFLGQRSTVARVVLREFVKLLINEWFIYFIYPSIWGFPDSSAGKESTCNAGDPSSVPRSGWSAGEGIDYHLQYSWASLVAQLVKNPPAMWETWVLSLDWEDSPREGEKLPTPVFWPREFHGLHSPWGREESNMTERLWFWSIHPSNIISVLTMCQEIFWVLDALMNEFCISLQILGEHSGETSFREMREF